MALHWQWLTRSARAGPLDSASAPPAAPLESFGLHSVHCSTVPKPNGAPWEPPSLSLKKAWTSNTIAIVICQQPARTPCLHVDRGQICETASKTGFCVETSERGGPFSPFRHRLRDRSVKSWIRRQKSLHNSRQNSRQKVDL